MTFQYAAGDFLFPTSFAALLMSGVEDDGLSDLQAQAPLLLHPGTLESVVPPSVLGGGGKRALMDQLHIPSERKQKALCIPAEWVAAKKQVQRSRRQMVSDRVRSLGKLIPGEGKRMSTAEMLKEAYDYVKFLEAQMMVLSSMPAGGGGVLEAVVNSPEAQAALTSNRCCVVPEEQLMLLRRLFDQQPSRLGQGHSPPLN